MPTAALAISFLLLAAAPLEANVSPAPEVEVAGAEAGTVRVPSAPGAWGGPRTGKEPTLSDRVADYDIRAVLDPVKHTITGTEKLTWRNRSAIPIRSVYLHLYANAFESEGSTFMREQRRHGGFRSDVETREGDWGHIELRRVEQGGRPATWSFVHPDGGPETDHTVVRVDLPEAVPPGGTTTLQIEFFHQMPRVVARAGYFDTFHLAGQWYPKIGVLELPGERGATAPRWNAHEYHLNSEFYADFGAYDLEVVVPDGYRVAASGSTVDRPRKGPDGVSWKFRAEDVHDVVFTAWDGFAPPLHGTWTGPGSPQVRIEVWYPPEFERAAKEALEATTDALSYFSRTLGPYPYTHLTVLVPPFNAFEAGGMEYETFFTTIASNEFPVQRRGRYPGGHGPRVRPRLLHGHPRHERVRGTLPRRGDEPALGRAHAGRRGLPPAAAGAGSLAGLPPPPARHLGPRARLGHRPSPGRPDRRELVEALVDRELQPRLLPHGARLPRPRAGARHRALREGHEALLRALALPAPGHRRPARGVRRRRGRPGVHRALVRAAGLRERPGGRPDREGHRHRGAPIPSARWR